MFSILDFIAAVIVVHESKHPLVALFGLPGFPERGSVLHKDQERSYSVSAVRLKRSACCFKKRKEKKGVVNNTLQSFVLSNYSYNNIITFNLLCVLIAMYGSRRLEKNEVQGNS